jgi:CheY-like chemotaxis protein
VANNGKEGVDIVVERMQSNEKTFDLILMDIHMPVMDGLEAASRIALMGIKTPVVALTANIMVNDIELYKKSGMPDYISKPFTSQELWKCLAKYLHVLRFSVIDETRQSEENEKMLKHLMVNFVRSNQSTNAEILKAVESGDIKLAHRLTHALKSNAGQIGEIGLQKAAITVEEILKAAIAIDPLTAEQPHIQFQDNQLELLETELKSVLEKLAPLLDEEGSKAKSKKITDKEELRKLFEQLETMLKEKNPQCMNLLDDIQTIPEAEELAHQIAEFEFKEAAVKLAALKKRLGIE